MSSKFPKTRYQGSKYKLKEWIWSSVEDLDFNTVLDGFSGTSTMSYLFKEKGKKVFSNDIYKFNYHISKALIENNTTNIEQEDIDFVLTKQKKTYKNTIEKNFEDTYYTVEENQWLDYIVQNIEELNNEYKKSMFFWALFQSCIIKRPYNLFHRKNLHIRTKEVERSFGNKKTWDTPFEKHFLKFVNEINTAVLDNKESNKSFCEDILNLSLKVDLIYLDPPYIPLKGSITNYGDFYHFLEGLTMYNNWEDNIDYKSKHKKLLSDYSIWNDKTKINEGFETIINNFKDSKFVISYRKDGIPSVQDIEQMLINIGKKVTIKEIDYKYVFSKKKDLKEVLIIAE